MYQCLPLLRSERDCKDFKRLHTRSCGNSFKLPQSAVHSSCVKRLHRGIDTRPTTKESVSVQQLRGLQLFVATIMNGQSPRVRSRLYLRNRHFSPAVIDRKHVPAVYFLTPPNFKLLPAVNAACRFGHIVDRQYRETKQDVRNSRSATKPFALQRSVVQPNSQCKGTNVILSSMAGAC